MKFFKALPLELLMWVGALLYLFFIDPHAEHTTICLFKIMGFTWCPGCGIGHSISYFMHGEMVNSFHAHWFGSIALFVLLHRVVVLSKDYYQNNIINFKTN